MNKLLAMLAIGAALCLSATSSLAQDNGNGGNGGGGQGGQGRRGFRNGGGGGNFDPAQMQQRMLQRYKDDLGFTNDTDWSAVEPLVTKVMDARRDAMSGMFGRFGRGGGGPGGGGGNAPTNPE